ncbi:Gfo/Idh/MocA family protein [Camelliibacillus cellulosilyticus]|uniref:Gfo/Idh/MocA family protein n=1 Tax=Camelliibacillus cellulosilyticus TaxID=2174486 RepID=A0ABV9GQ57_9BACL
MKFGTVGTGWITETFIEAAHETGLMELSGVYSRTLEKAERLSETYQPALVVNKIQRLAESDIDVVYIASPNALHYDHARLFIEHGKHVICEKPIFSNLNEWDAAQRLAEQHGVFLFEAMRNLHTPNFLQLKKHLEKVGTIRGALLHYIQYSSRYDRFLDGETPNVFSPDFSGGALVDLGVYPLALAVGLFGEPQRVTYHPVLLRSGIDGAGTLVLSYDGFQCTILCSKIAHSTLASEIHGESGTITLDRVAPIGSLHWTDNHTKLTEAVGVSQKGNDMVYEIEAFANIIEKNDKARYEGLSAISRSVLSITEQARKQNQILFASERGNLGAR